MHRLAELASFLPQKFSSPIQRTHNHIIEVAYWGMFTTLNEVALLPTTVIQTSTIFHRKCLWDYPILTMSPKNLLFFSCNHYRFYKASFSHFQKLKWPTLRSWWFVFFFFWVMAESSVFIFQNCTWSLTQKSQHVVLQRMLVYQECRLLRVCFAMGYIRSQT